MSPLQFIQDMPKVELHIHLEGAIEPATLLLLADRNHVALPGDTIDALRTWYQFSDFSHFIDVYLTIQRCLRSADDFSLIAYELGADMARQNIWYREATVTPYSHLWQNKGTAAEDIIDGLEDGRRRARRDFDVEIRWIMDIPRNLPPPAAERTAQLAIDWANQGVVALGLGGNEATSPPGQFAPYFEKALAAGLHSAPHAGETAGPASVWAALRELKAERLGHGVRSIEDPELLAYLKAEQVPLEVNPSSNVCLKVYRNIEQHPIVHLIKMGLLVTVNSDDPPLFDTTLTEEFAKLLNTFELDTGDLETLTLNAARSAFLPVDQRDALEADIALEFKRLRRLSLS
ncbi:MAG: adenosine deaminase [Chloroflexota bacterium]|nr:adenosine deaminase [Chloroflexota bacterium]